MEGIHLPMSQGTMDDITQEGETSSQVDNSTGESMNTQGARAIYEREAHIVIDYSRLSEDNKDVCHHFSCSKHETKRVEQSVPLLREARLNSCLNLWLLQLGLQVVQFNYTLIWENICIK